MLICSSKFADFFFVFDVRKVRVILLMHRENPLFFGLSLDETFSDSNCEAMEDVVVEKMGSMG